MVNQVVVGSQWVTSCKIESEKNSQLNNDKNSKKLRDAMKLGFAGTFQLTILIDERVET
ncbi:hypothetical protein [Nitrosomonas sp.]|uniref:hypothetical protein n=1 Tax=Nitrosomonas sp. TaxID=42353 RepID=UPI00261AFD9F|nr:hypothetical protein [Nitrosomonas sp.]